MPATNTMMASWTQPGRAWLNAAQEWTDTALEYWRDCLDARTPEDFADVQAFYAEKQTRSMLRLLGGADRPPELRP